MKFQHYFSNDDLGVFIKRNLSLKEILNGVDYDYFDELFENDIDLLVIEDDELDESCLEFIE